MESAGVADPTTVLTTINTGQLQVASVPTSSEPTTPSSESPLTLNSSLREWLAEAVAGSTNPKVYTKLLVSNAAAGSVIGKGGGNINDVQARTFARIQLSKANEYFPGTTERTLLVTGRLKQVVAALGLVFSKLLKEGVAPLSPRSKAAAAFPGPTDSSRAAEEGASLAMPPPLHLLVRLLVPQPLCGVIIGKHGCTIRNYAANTNTVIRVTSSEVAQAPISHRIVTIAGEQEGVLKAVALMVLKQSDDPKFQLYGELPSPAVPDMVTHGSFGMPPEILSQHVSQPFVPGYTSLSLMLTEGQAGILLEHGSRAVVEAEQMTGCRIRLEVVDGPCGPLGRLLLTGAPDVVSRAQWLLGQRLTASYQLGGTTYYAASTGFVAAPPLPGMHFISAPWQIGLGLSSGSHSSTQKINLGT